MRKFIQSTTHAFRGKQIAFRHGRNFRIKVAIGLLVVISGYVFGVTRMEWALLVFCIGAVLAAELCNTALEILADRVTREHDEMIRDVKDCAAGAVLALSIAAAAVGAIIFLPYIF